MSEPFLLVWEEGGSGFADLQRLACHVNDRPYLGYPAGELLAQRYLAVPCRRPSGLVAWRVRLRLIPNPSPGKLIGGIWLNDPNFLANPWPRADFGAAIPAHAEVQST